MPEDRDSSPTRIVADADVLAADLLVGGPAREALDAIRSHSWLTLVASDPLLDDSEAVIADLADDDLASDWCEQVESLREPVEHPAGDHPALASAYRGQAAHLLSFDEDLRTKAGPTLGSRLDVSVKTPAGFVALFDAASLYEAVVAEDGEAYPGPDRDPRA